MNPNPNAQGLRCNLNPNPNVQGLYTVAQPARCPMITTHSSWREKKRDNNSRGSRSEVDICCALVAMKINLARSQLTLPCTFFFLHIVKLMFCWLGLKSDLLKLAPLPPSPPPPMRSAHSPLLCLMLKNRFFPKNVNHFVTFEILNAL